MGTGTMITKRMVDAGWHKVRELAEENNITSYLAMAPQRTVKVAMGQIYKAMAAAAPAVKVKTKPKKELPPRRRTGRPVCQDEE